MNDHSKFIPDTNATNVLNFEFTPTDPNDINYRLLENGMNLSYISWAKAWKMLKEKYPNANYRSTPTEIFGTKFMRVEVTNGYIAHEEHYPVHAWNGTEITQDDINIAIRRGLTKAIAHFGIGLDLYIQEDSEMQKKDMLLDANKALEEIVALSIKLGKPTDFKSLVESTLKAKKLPFTQTKEFQSLNVETFQELDVEQLQATLKYQTS